MKYGNVCDITEMLTTQLLAKSQKIEVEWWRMSAVSVQNGIPQQLSDPTWFWYILIAKKWTYAQSECFFEEKPSCFDKPVQS